MIDIFIVVVILWAIYNGWRAGLLKEVISTVGFLVGLLVAATCYSTFGEYLTVEGTETNMVTSIIAFLLLWIAVPIMLGLIANLLTRALKGMHLGLPNSLLGALVSLAKYTILLSCVLNVMVGLHIMDTEKAGDSHLFGPTCDVLKFCFKQTGEILSSHADQAAEDTVWIDMTGKQ